MPTETTLAEIWDALGGPPELHRRIAFSGPIEALPSVFRVTDFAAASVGAATLAAIELWRERGAQPPDRVTIDRLHAAATFRSERYLRRDGDPIQAWDEIAGYYRTADDRWVQLHTNYPHHRAGVIALLGCSDDRAAVEAAIASAWTAQELEDRLHEAGMCCTMLRTRGEWLETGQAAALRTLPLIDTRNLAGDAPLRRPTNPSRPLDGVRVLDLTRVIAGPVCTRVLAQHGAQVLKVNSPHLPTIELSVVDTGFGKRSCHLDLDLPADRETFLDLVRDADVVVQGYRGGSFDERGLGPDDLTELNPRLVHVTLSAFGHEGPWRHRRGFDSLVQTATGIGDAGARAAGVEGTRPLPCQALDHGAGWLMAAATMRALAEQHRTPGARAVRTSLAQVGHHLVEMGPNDALDVDDPDLTAVEHLLGETDSAFGHLRFVEPPGVLTEPSTYPSPPIPIGANPPAWD